MIDNLSYKAWVGSGLTMYNLVNRFKAFDGVSRSITIMFKLPRPAHNYELTSEELDHMNNHFIQAAGSSNAMTIETKKNDSGGEPRLYTVGRPPPEGQTAERRIPITFGNNRTVTVNANEVFDAEEAAQIFFSYYKNDEIPDSYVLRPTEW